MKKNYFKSMQLLIIVLSLFIGTCFHSCNKLETLEWSTWESDYFEMEYKDTALPPHPYLDEELILRGKVTVFFEENYASIWVHSFGLFDKKNNIMYYCYDNTQYLGANYTYDGKNVTLSFYPSTSFFSKQRWTGKMKKKTMDLKVFFGETVIFRKKS